MMFEVGMHCQDREQHLEKYKIEKIKICLFQTFVPLVFVYIPYACAINFPFFRIPIYFVGDMCMTLTSCFPAWDAIIIIVIMKVG